MDHWESRIFPHLIWKNRVCMPRNVTPISILGRVHVWLHPCNSVFKLSFNHILIYLKHRSLLDGFKYYNTHKAQLPVLWGESRSVVLISKRCIDAVVVQVQTNSRDWHWFPQDWILTSVHLWTKWLMLSDIWCRKSYHDDIFITEVWHHTGKFCDQ